METIKTASTLERIVRNGIFTVMVVIFAVWSLYDGYIGYPRENIAQIRQELPPDKQHLAEINEKVREERIQALKKGQRLQEIEAELGEAAWKERDPSGASKAVWFGPGGALIVHSNNPGVLVRAPEWKKAPHTELDLTFQKIMGYVLLPLGIILVIRWIAMMFRGARLSDEGLKPSGRPLIPYEAMTGWDTSDYTKKGRIRLAYELDGREGSYVLDDYKLRAFPVIVEEISDRRGFENPIRKEPASEAAGRREEEIP